jgi:excisionase family DNA binding protein
MQLTTPQAAELTGKSRSTIWRACKRGRLSALKTDTGDYLIEPAELERVFGSLQQRNRSHADAPKPNATVPATALLEQELEHTRELLDRERAVFDRDRRVWEDERTFLRHLVEQHTEQLRLITHEPAEPEQRRAGFWRRLVGGG